MRAVAALLLALFTSFSTAKAQDATSAESLAKEYAANPLAADAKLLGKAVAAHGTVSALKKDEDGACFLILGPKDEVYCYFESSCEGELAKLSKGDQVSFRGVCKGLVKKGRKDRVLLVDCKFGLADAQVPAKSASFKKSLMILSGPKGSGSGFVAKIGGVKYVVSNFHVFFENNPKIFDSEDRPVEVKAIKFTPDRDLALFELAKQDAYESLEIRPDVTSLPVGSALRVYGNSGGGEVFTEIGGKALGSGPRVVETDAEFIEGNSGSPVLEYPSLKVVGVATYASVLNPNWSGKGTRFEKIRRFATRIDNLDPASFDVYEKASFESDAATFRNIKDSAMLKASALANLSGLGLFEGKDASESSPYWKELLLYSGKTLDGAQRARLIALIGQWNLEMAKFLGSQKSSPFQSQAPKKLGLDQSSAPSLQKLPYEELCRILFPKAPKAKPSCKYFAFQAEELYDASSVLQERFEKRFEDIKATFKK